VADGFVVRDRPAADGQGPWGFLNRAGARAFGTGLVITEALELGAEDLFDGPTGEGLGHVDGQRFDRVEIQIEPGSGVAEGAAGDDFPPAVGQVAQIGPILGLALGERHRRFVLELGDGEESGNRS
jgi:hypothetical protein